MAELDGVWDVRRLSGALPPLTGVRKRIDGASGETVVPGGRGVPFDVRGLELRYRAPLAFLVDVLEPRGDAYHGRATAFGRTYGEFELRRSAVDATETDLIRHIDEAHALEQTVARMLDGLIRSATDQELVDRLRQHKVETQRHESLMRGRLEAHGAQPSALRDLAAEAGGAGFVLFARVQPDTPGKLATHAYSYEHLELAAYELLARLAELAGDHETGVVAHRIRGEEAAMAARLEAIFARTASASLTRAHATIRARAWRPTSTTRTRWSSRR